MPVRRVGAAGGYGPRTRERAGGSAPQADAAATGISEGPWLILHRRPLQLPAGRCQGVPRSGLQIATRRRPRTLSNPDDGFSWSDERWRGCALEDLVDLRTRTSGRSRRKGPSTRSATTWRHCGPRGHGHRADAGRPVSRQPQLGLRRRLSLRRPELVRRGRRDCSGSSMPATPRARRCCSTWSTTTSAPRATTLAISAPTSPTATTRPGGRRSTSTGRGAPACGEFVVENARAVGARLPSRRAAARRGARDLRRLRPRHILAELTEAVREAAPGRLVHVIAESDENDARLITPVTAGGLRPGRAVERRFPPRAARRADGRAARATTRTSAASNTSRRPIARGSCTRASTRRSEGAHTARRRHASR